MKTKNRTQTAFAQPDVSWSRKRSLRIVIRIQIQITKKKISSTTRRNSPKLTSASGKVGSFRSEQLFAGRLEESLSGRSAGADNPGRGGSADPVRGLEIRQPL